MKIAILGTRGIPNKYGGFEQCAEKLSERWVKKGHDVVVYNPDIHEYSKDEWKGVKIKRIFSKEDRLGIWGTFAYDYLCLKDAVKSDFDVILNLGYVPSALFFGLRKKANSVFFTNMDGLEWKRQKWGSLLKKFIKFCEKRAIKFSDCLICDNPGIEDFYKSKTDGKTVYIPYGAEIFENPQKEVLEDYGVSPKNYYLLIARLEPENNIEMILEGYVSANSKEPFLVVGNYKTKYGKFLKEKFEKSGNIRFLGGIYDYDKLSTLRMFAKLYFHGHSVGGTNPSLLEAMASGALIAAHNNPFNRYVLGENGFYFSSKEDVSRVLAEFDEGKRDKFVRENKNRILEEFNWDSVAQSYLDVFESTAVL